MTEPRFFTDPSPLDLDRLIALTGARVSGSARHTLAITGVAPLGRAGPSDLTWFDPGAGSVASSRAGACLVRPEDADRAPLGPIALLAPEPDRAYASVAAALFPGALRPQPVFGTGVSPGAIIHADARFEPDVAVDPGAVIGPGVEIGAGAVIGANVVIGAGVRVGRRSTIGAGASVSHGLIGDRVAIGEGARIGQAGAGGSAPSAGRVIVQDDVRIGANVAIDRGTDRDTVIGEGARIDNLAQIGHNVVIGRRSVVFAGVVVAGDVVLADFAAFDGLAARS